MTLRRWFWGALLLVFTVVVVLEGGQRINPLLTGFAVPPAQPVLLPTTAIEPTPRINELSIDAVLDARGSMPVTYRAVVNTEDIAEPLLTVDLPVVRPVADGKQHVVTTIQSAEVAVDAGVGVPAAHFELPGTTGGYVFERYLIRPSGKRTSTTVTFRYTVDSPLVGDGKNAQLTWYFDIFSKAPGSPAVMTMTFAQPPLSAVCHTVNIWGRALIEPCHGQAPELEQGTITLPVGWSMNESILTFTLPRSEATQLAPLQSFPSRTPVKLIAGSLLGWLLLALGSVYVLRRRRQQRQRIAVWQQVVGLSLGLAVSWVAYQMAVGPLQRSYGLGTAVGWGIVVIPSLLIATTIGVFAWPGSPQASRTQQS